VSSGTAQLELKGWMGGAMLAIQKIVDHAGGCGAHVLKCARRGTPANT